MTKQLLTAGLLIIITVTGFSHSKLTPKQISRRNYQEVIGDKTNSADSIVLLCKLPQK